MRVLLLGVIVFMVCSIQSQETYILDLKNTYIKKGEIRRYKKYTNLSTLKFTYNGLDSIPDFAFNYQFLLKLEVKDNPIKKISEKIGQLKSLRYLALKGTELDSFPDAFSELRSLRELTLVDNSFRFNKPFLITDTITYMSKLTKLTLHQVYLDSVKVNLGQLKSLKELRMTDCNITYISSLENSISLTSINLDNNKLYELPNGILSLKNLKYLSLKNNYLTEIPEKIYKLKLLKTLDLRGNFLDQYQKDLLSALLPLCNILFD